MYLTHFGLKQLPFGITPDPAFFFSGNQRGEILEALIYAVEHGDGIIKVTGEVGSGKTTLCRMLEKKLADQVEVLYLVNPTLTREQVIYTIAGELELQIDGKRPDEVLRMLNAELISKHISGKQVVLLIEEAQAMSLDTLEEIRLLSNLETSHHKLLQIVMFGQPELDASLNLPQMRQLKERISNGFTVPPMTPTNVPEYLRFRLRMAGYHGPDIFTPGAAKLISRASRGILRRISILADKALLAAFAANAGAITEVHVRAAIADSEFNRSPLPWLDYRHGLVLIGLTGLIGLVTTGLFWSGILAARHPEARAAVGPAPTVKTASAPAPAFVPASAPASAPAKINPVVTTPARPEPVPAQRADTATVVAIGQRLLQTDAWLAERSPDQFSIQIALVASADQNEIAHYLNHMEAQTGLDLVHVYRAQKNAIPYFGILYGQYPNKTDAILTINELTAKWGYKPQLRTIAGIKKEKERS